MAVEAKRLGADVSLLLYRRTEHEMPAYEHEVELARHEGVEIRFLTSPVAIVGDDRVEGVRCAEMRLGDPDESGRRRPEPVPDSEFVIAVDTVVKAIGQRPRDEFRSTARGRGRAGTDVEREDLCRRRRRQRRRKRRRGRARGEARGPRAGRVAAMSEPDRDPLARACRTGREDGRPDPGPRAAASDGKGVQAFPEYGPERRGAPLRAFTRVADRPIRRHDTITDPDLVVVLEPSLVHEAGVADGLRRKGSCSSTPSEAPPELDGVDVRCVPATQARSEPGSGFVNMVMLGAVARRSASRRSGPAGRCGRDARPEGADRDVRAAVAEGYAWLS